MPNRRVVATVCLGALSAWLLSGCIFGIAPVRPLPREAFASVEEVALAVGDDGMKHYAWTECFGEDATYTCVLVYSRVATGAVIYSYGFVTPIGNFSRYPDVAVTDSGDAYVVRSECTDFNDCVDYWTVFPAINPGAVEPVANLLHTSEVDSEGPPVVEARGTDAYAAYYVTVSGFVRLRYRQLTGGSRSGYIDSSVLSPVDASLAIDANGDLHAAWVRNPVTDTFVAYSNNIGALGDFPAAGTFEGGGNDYLITHPVLALDSEERPYLAYTINSGLDDTIKVRCLDVPADCYRDATLLTVPEVDGGWNVYRNVDLEMIGLQPQVVFAATHDSLAYNELWWYRPASTGGNTEPARVTNTANANEGAPRIVKENSTAGDIPVIGWRMYEVNLAGVQAPEGSPGTCFGDAYMLYYSTAEIQRVFEDRGTCANSGADLASNGPWVAGVWTDEESDQIASHAAWTTFNTYRVDLPLVKR